MEQYFSSLSKRQTMLLLTSLAFGGADAMASFAHLPAEEEELLKFRAQALLQIPRDRRVPLLVQEIKRLVTARRRQLSSADPRRLADVLSKERPVMIEVVLRALPVELAEAVRASIPNHPTIRLQHEVGQDVLAIIRWKLEEALQHNTPRVGTFRFTDLLTLQQREILSVCDRMGARVLATAIAGLQQADADALFARLPPDQRNLAMKAAEAGRSKRLAEDDAKTVLEMHGALETPSEGMRSAGAQRLMRACVAQSAEFAQRMVERYSGDLGKLLHRWMKDEKKRAVKGDGGRLDIVEQLERLAQKGIIDRPMRLPPPFRPPGAAASSVRPPTVAMPRSSSSPEQPANFAPTSKPERRAGGGPLPRARTVSSVAEPSHASSVSSPSHRIIRDGKPLVRESESEAGPLPKRKVSASPAFQEIPRRKTNDASKSPVVKGSGRGPSGGSR